jgi:hypothetical protein
MLEKHGIKDVYDWDEDDKVEIQVVSALGNAWAEAGHDVLYKSYAYGPAPVQEQRILDALNGLVQSGDLLLEQFHELVMKRTYAKFAHVDELAAFLRGLDVLQGPHKPRKFAGGGLDVLLAFLKSEGKNYPLAVRTAIKELGFPEDPKLDDFMRTRFQPAFEPDDSMLATICLIRHMLSDPYQGGGTDLPLAKKCCVMISAMTLLQEFAGDADRATNFLRGEFAKLMTAEDKTGLDFVLGDEYRQVFIEDHAENEGHQRRCAVMLNPAWEWFQKQARQSRSICGLVFRLAEIGATKDWKASINQLKIEQLTEQLDCDNELCSDEEC